MTDPLVPGDRDVPEPELDPADAGPVGTLPPEAPTGRQPAGRKGALIAIGVLVVPLAIILWAVKDNASAGDLKAGDCFDVPTSASVTTVQHHPCNEGHTGEVIAVAEYSEGGTTYPISFVLEPFVNATCVPAFQAYVGSDVDAVPDLSIGYFYPTRDGWSSGDRTVTCYATRTDEAQMTKSLKGSATP